MIRFLRDYRTQAIPPEVFTKGQELSDRSADSEMHFVRRGAAGFLIEGKLYDHEHRLIDEDGGDVEVINVADNRDAGTDRAGEGTLLDGTPPRASSGPGVVTTTAAVASVAMPNAEPKPKAAPKPRAKAPAPSAS